MAQEDRDPFVADPARARREDRDRKPAPAASGPARRRRANRAASSDDPRRLVARHRATTAALEKGHRERERLQDREAMMRHEFGDAWFDAGHQLPSRGRVVFLSLLFPGLGHRSLYDEEGATNYFIAGLVAWIAFLFLTGWFVLFGVTFIAVLIVYVLAVQSACARWDMLQGYRSQDVDHGMTAHTITYGPDGPVASETRID
jgi:hypothetical protein